MADLSSATAVSCCFVCGNWPMPPRVGGCTASKSDPVRRVDRRLDEANFVAKFGYRRRVFCITSLGESIGKMKLRSVCQTKPWKETQHKSSVVNFLCFCGDK